jgi:ABC-type multidrug transport system fused ATPase/permease subunit
MKALVNLWIHRNALRRLIGRKAAFWLVLGAIAGLLVAMTEILISMQVGLILQMIGAVQLPTNFAQGLEGKTFTYFCGTLILFAILRGTGYFLISQSGTIAQHSIMLRLRVLAFQETFCRANGFISISNLSALVADVFPQAAQFCWALAAFVPAIIQLAAICGMLAYKSLLLTALGMFGIGTVGWIVHLANMRMRRIAIRFPQLFEILLNRMNRMTKNWFFLKAVRKMDEEFQSLVNASVDLGDSVIQAYNLGNSAAVLPQSLGIIVILGLIGAQMHYHPVTAISFVSFLYLFFRLIQVLGSLAVNYSLANSCFNHFSLAMDYVEKLKPLAFPSAKAAIARTYTWKRSTGSNAYKPTSSFSENESPNAPPGIELAKACFRYQSDLPWAVKDFSLHIPPGGRVALMGPSGSGKSTIIALCLGVLQPESGVVRVGGLEPETFFEKYSHRLGYVGAEPFLIAGSIRENLIYGLKRACSDADLLEALNNVSLNEWASRIPQPLEYQITEMGEGLSTGQKQRLMLARALLRQPLLLVLDEMSANLDAQSEYEIKQMIARLERCTVLTVSHRIGFVKDTHEIVELNRN